MPKASVIVAAFNGEAYIGDCLRSIAGQTEKDIEIIVVDDGSSDGTVAALRELTATDNRIKVYPTEHSGYASVARNMGLSLATGEFVAFLDHDDLYHPAKIERCLRIFEACPDVDIAFHDLRRFQGQPGNALTFFETVRFPERAAHCVKHVEGSIYYCEKEFYNFISAQFSPLHTSAVVLRRSVLAQVAGWFREDMRLGEDTDFWYRILKERRAAFDSEVLSYYRQRPGSLTDDLVRYLTGVIQANSENLKRGADVLSKAETRILRSKIAAQLFDLGYQHFCRSQGRKARAAYWRSMTIEFHAKTLAAYLKALFPGTVVRFLRRNADGEPTA